MSYDTVIDEVVKNDRWFRVVYEKMGIRRNIYRNIFLAPPIMNMKAINKNVDDLGDTCIQRCYEAIAQLSFDNSMRSITKRAEDVADKVGECIDGLYKQHVYASWRKNEHWISAELFYCICKKHKNSLLTYYMRAVDIIYDYDNKLLILNRLRRELDECYPGYPIAKVDSLEVSISNAMYSLLLLGAIADEKSIAKDNVLKRQLLPLEKVLPQFRSSANRKKDELEDYEKIIVAYPVKSIERYFALKQLWESDRNYYAGWDLSSIIYYGDTLWSADGRRKYIIPSNHAEAIIILKKLKAVEVKKGKAPIPVLYQMEKEENKSLLQDGERRQYIPTQLQRYEMQVLESLKSGKSISFNKKSEMLGNLRAIERHEFIESKCLQYQLYRKCNETGMAEEIKKDIIHNEIYKYSKEAFETFMLNDSFGTIELKDEQYRQGALLGSTHCLRELLCAGINKEMVTETCVHILTNEPSPEQVEIVSEVYAQKLKEKDSMDIEKDIIPILIIKLKLLIENKSLQEKYIQKNDFSSNAGEKISQIRKEIDDIRQRVMSFQQWYARNLRNDNSI